MLLAIYVSMLIGFILVYSPNEKGRASVCRTQLLVDCAAQQAQQRCYLLSSWKLPTTAAYGLLAKIEHKIE